jgi:Uma2 family endonuclease
MSTTTHTMTADELLSLPKDGMRYELVRGELKQMAPAGFEHGIVIARLTWRLGQHVETHNLGVVCGAETGFKITDNPDTVRAPDIAFVSSERLAEIGITKKFWAGAPDLAVEVLSP